MPPQTAAPQTNPLHAAVTPAKGGVGYQIQRSTFDFTGYQGHNFHGLRIQYIDGGLLEDLDILGGYGDAAGPPGETFVETGYKANGWTARRVRIDGRNTAASGWGLNSLSGWRISDSSVVNCQGWGMPIWQCSDVQTTNLFLDNGRGLNHERSTKCVHKGLRVHLRTSPFDGDRRHVTWQHDSADMSDCSVDVAEWSGGLDGPLAPSPFVIACPTKYQGQPNKAVAKYGQFTYNGVPFKLTTSEAEARANMKTTALVMR